ncbi:MAG: AAA family ATPase [Chlamydiales bacterium]|nr:AAA family ATPase [Chlamydiales bacterium]
MERKSLNQLISWKNSPNRKPLVLRGARQVGKTYLLQQFGKSEFNNCHYFNFEENKSLKACFQQSLNPEKILQELQFQSSREIELQNDLIIFDEIQECPQALTSLKYFYEKKPEIAICSAGSLIGVHLNEGSFPVGKVDLLDMYPMSFNEFLTALNETKALEFLKNWGINDSFPLSLHEKLWERLKWYFITGGLPEVVQVFLNHQDNLLVAFEKVRERQQQLLIGYLADIAKHSGKANAMHIERVLKSIPAQLSRSCDGSAKRFQFKGVVPKVDKYSRLVNSIDWLEAANILLKVSIVNKAAIPFIAYAKESRFKLLLFDVGLLGAMSALPPKTILDYDYGSYKGYFAENFIAQELLCSGFSQLYSWEEDRSEVEFIIERGGEIVPVEVKSGNITKAQSLAKFCSKYSCPKSVILSAKEPKYKENLLRAPLYMAGDLSNLLDLC